MTRRYTRRAAEPQPYLLRAPTSCGDFLAWWPESVTAEDLMRMRALFDVVMDGWLSSLASREAARAPGDIEYESWGAPSAQGEQP